MLFTHEFPFGKSQTDLLATQRWRGLKPRQQRVCKSYSILSEGFKMETLGIGCLIFILSLQYGLAGETSPSNRIVLTLDNNAKVLIKGFIAPIEYTQDNFHLTWDALANLRVAEPEKHQPTSVFEAFLPTEARLQKGREKPSLQELKRSPHENPTKKGNSVSVGDIWQIEQDGLLELLRQLHPNPNLDMHLNWGDSRGAWACLRAYNAEFADIVFRIHAEFKLENGWFTPSQFTGNLVINRTEGKIAFFKMSVPKRTINFDVNRYHRAGGRSFGADMGFCPQIELRTGTENIIQDTQFSEAITLAEAKRVLTLRFYKSQQINWVSVNEALEIAQAQQKPIHVVSINGPLDDEACGGSGKGLRATALSDDGNIKFLNENFVNTWVLNTDMKRLRDAKGIDEMLPLTQTIVRAWKKNSPTDCLIISPELELMGRQPVNELSRHKWHMKVEHYRLLLVESLEGKRPGLGEKDPVALSSSLNVVLDRAQPSIEVLDTFQAPAADSQEYTVIKIDATAFENGGTLTIDIHVGRAASVGAFDLLDGNSDLPTEETPENILAQAWGIQPSETRTITYQFDKGQVFQLRATGGWVGEKGSINAFRARISIRESIN